MTKDEALAQPAQVKRLEVIDNNGRYYVNMGVDKLEFSYQDDGKTLKLFTNGAGTLQTEQEPFGYFTALPFGWTDCREDDEGAIALYEHPAPSWQRLTDDDVGNIYDNCQKIIAETNIKKVGENALDVFLKGISNAIKTAILKSEQALKQKNS